MFRYLLAALLGLTVLTPALAQQVSADKVRVQFVLRDTSEPLRVYYATKGSITGGLLVPFFAVGNAIRMDERGDRLTQAVGDYARADALKASMDKTLPAKYALFEVSSVVEQGGHAGDAEIAKRAREQGFQFVVIVDEEFAGLTSGSVAARTDQVSVIELVHFELFDAATGQLLQKANVFANSLTREGLNQALASGEFFRSNFPSVSDALAAIIVGELTRSDQLHAMAASIGKGDAVPAQAGVLAHYQNALKIVPVAPAGWHVVKLNTPYAKVAEPKGELRYKLGVRFDVDLLVSEFGQDVGSIEDYLAAASDRYAQAGLDVSTLAPYTGPLSVPGYSAYSIKRQGGTGGQLMFYRMLDKPYLALRAVVATEDMDGLLAANSEAIQSVLQDSRISVDLSKVKR